MPRQPLDDKTERKALATELIRLTRPFEQPQQANFSEKHQKLFEEMHNKQIGLLTDLYAEHMNVEILRAQLEFVRSEHGQAIQQAHLLIQRDFVERIHELNSTTDESGRSRLSAAIKRNPDDE